MRKGPSSFVENVIREDRSILDLSMASIVPERARVTTGYHAPGFRR